MLSKQLRNLAIKSSGNSFFMGLRSSQMMTNQQVQNFSSFNSTFHAKDLKIEQRQPKLQKPNTQNGDPYAFGRVFTDHMIQIDYNAENGWDAPKIVPYGSFPMAITASSLHYGISAYEGITVVKNKDTNAPQAFRVRDNLNSFKLSNEHLDLPTFDTEELLKCIQGLVKVDQDWFPNIKDLNSQLYVRLNHVSTDPTLGVKSPRFTKLYAILNPNTFKKKSLKIKCSQDASKSWPLGHGQYRLSGNLGPLLPQLVDARNNGFDDVLWLLDDYVHEMTVLNVFAYMKNRFGDYELITPANDGCIFNGTIRQSILEMADEIQKEKKVKVVERSLSIHEIINAYKEERLIEFFGGATSSNIQSISRLQFRDQTIDLSGRPTPLADHLNNKLLSIMTGPSDHKWVTPLL